MAKLEAYGVTPFACPHLPPSQSVCDLSKRLPYLWIIPVARLMMFALCIFFCAYVLLPCSKTPFGVLVHQDVV